MEGLHGVSCVFVALRDPASFLPRRLNPELSGGLFELFEMVQGNDGAIFKTVLFTPGFGRAGQSGFGIAGDGQHIFSYTLNEMVHAGAGFFFGDKEVEFHDHDEATVSGGGPFFSQFFCPGVILAYKCAAPVNAQGCVAHRFKKGGRDLFLEGVVFGAALVIGQDAGGGVQDEGGFLLRGEAETDGGISKVSGGDTFGVVEPDGVAALNGKGGAAFFHCSTHVMTGRTVVTDVADGTGGDASFVGFLDGHFCGLHHRGIAQAAVSVEQDSSVGFFEDMKLRVGVDLFVPDGSAVAVEGADAVGVDTAQGGVG